MQEVTIDVHFSRVRVHEDCCLTAQEEKAINDAMLREARSTFTAACFAVLPNH